VAEASDRSGVFENNCTEVEEDQVSGDPWGSGQTWDYTKLRELLTTERLGSYFEEAHGDLGGAFSLYEWNLVASAEVMKTTGMVEVVVRNALDEQLRAWAVVRGGTTWLETAVLDARGRADVLKARDRATRFGRLPEVHSKVVAELSLGFWRYLVASRYLTSLWVPGLHRAFPNGPADLGVRRRSVERHLKDLMLVRNRAAHHEPIHRRDLLADLAAAAEVAGWVSPDAGSWVAGVSLISATVAAKPNFPAIDC